MEYRGSRIEDGSALAEFRSSILDLRSSVFVVGAGGIGCAVGYALIAAGMPITFVEADPDKILWGRNHGVQIDRRKPLPALFIPFEEWAPPAGATVLLCTKCYDNAPVLARLPTPTTLIPIQNGFDPLIEDRINDLEGIASFISECEPQRTRARITRQGCLHIGYRKGSEAPPSHEIVTRLRRAGLFRVAPVPCILPFKYTKLMYNAAISPLAAAAGLDNGQLLTVPKARRLFFQLLRENYDILHEAGVDLGKIGPFHPDTVARILRHSTMARMLAWAFYPTLRKTYCSMSGDLPKGQTEIDYYNRHLIDLAGNRPCPLNRRVYDLVKRMERERIRPQTRMLDELT
jgi:2-dehydropantoate 2-reductase